MSEQEALVVRGKVGGMHRVLWIHDGNASKHRAIFERSSCVLAPAWHEVFRAIGTGNEINVLICKLSCFFPFLVSTLQTSQPVSRPLSTMQSGRSTTQWIHVAHGRPFLLHVVTGVFASNPQTSELLRPPLTHHLQVTMR